MGVQDLSVTNFLGEKSGVFAQTGGSAADPLGIFTKSQTAPTVLDPGQLAQQQQLVQALFGQIGQTQGGFNQLPGFGQQLAQQGQGFLGGINQGQGLNPFIGQGSTDQQIAGVTGVVQNFLNQQLGGAGGIAGQANLAGQFGGSRQDILSGTAIGQAATGLGGITSDILGQDMLRRQQAALGQGQLGNQGALAGIAGLGDIFGLQAGGLLGSFGGLNQLQGLLGPPQQIGGGGTGGGSGAGGAGGLIGSIFSDERLKENITLLGFLASGQPFYRFNYIGWPDSQFIGVMAQQSPTDAVTVHDSGYLMVDYGRIH